MEEEKIAKDKEENPEKYKVKVYKLILLELRIIRSILKLQMNIFRFIFTGLYIYIF